MTFSNPHGLLLLLFLPLFAAVIFFAGRRRRRSIASFYLLREILSALPLLPRSDILRRRIQTLLLLGAVACIGAASGGLILGDADSEPLRVAIVLDHLSPRSRGSADGQSAAERAVSYLQSLRSDDRVLISRTDRGGVTAGFVPRDRAISAARKQKPTELPLDREAVISYLTLLHENHRPDYAFLATSYPDRWRESLQDADSPWEIVSAAPPVERTNFAILDIDILPDLLQPGLFSLYCRAGVFPPRNAVDIPRMASLAVSLNGVLVERRELVFSEDGTAGVLLKDFSAGEGLLSLELEPSDAFPGDNLFLAPLRSHPVVSASLVTTGNSPLEAALRALPGLALSIVAPGEEYPKAFQTDVAVFDGYVPEALAGNSLIIHPSRSLPGLPVHGDVIEPSFYLEDETNHLMEGVSFSGLQISRMPLILPGPELEVVAKADGHPLFLAGESPSGDRVAVLSFDPVEEWWIYDPAFPILIANIVSWLGSEARGRRSFYTVGESVSAVDLAPARALTDPLGQKTTLEEIDTKGFTFPLAGRYRLDGPGRDGPAEVFVNLLDERVSRSFTDGVDADGHPGITSPARPFRFDTQSTLIVLSLLMLLFESIAGPSRRVGRIPS